jgi:hypothetical protein
MEAPPLGQEVVAVLADGSELIAYWWYDHWKAGVADDPVDRDLREDEVVVSWRWRSD